MNLFIYFFLFLVSLSLSNANEDNTNWLGHKSFKDLESDSTDWAGRKFKGKDSLIIKPQSNEEYYKNQNTMKSEVIVDSSYVSPFGGVFIGVSNISLNHFPFDTANYDVVSVNTTGNKFNLGIMLGLKLNYGDIDRGDIIYLSGTHSNQKYERFNSAGNRSENSFMVNNFNLGYTPRYNISLNKNKYFEIGLGGHISLYSISKGEFDSFTSYGGGVDAIISLSSKNKIGFPYFINKDLGSVMMTYTKSGQIQVLEIKIIIHFGALSK